MLRKVKAIIEWWNGRGVKTDDIAYLAKPVLNRSIVVRSAQGTRGDGVIGRIVMLDSCEHSHARHNLQDSE